MQTVTSLSITRRRFLASIAGSANLAHIGVETLAGVGMAKYRPVYKAVGAGLFCQPDKDLPVIGRAERLFVGDIEAPAKGFVVNDHRARVRLIWRYKRRPQEGAYVDDQQLVTFGTAECFLVDKPEWKPLMSGFGRPVVRVERSRFFALRNPIILRTHPDKEWVGWTVESDKNGMWSVNFPEPGVQTRIDSFGMCLVYDGAGWGGMAFTFGTDMPKAGSPPVQGAKAF